MATRSSDDTGQQEHYDWSRFAGGFTAPSYTQVPDEILDEVMAHLTGAELKVLLYIVRRTFGFKKSEDAISLEQICRGIITRAGRRLDHGTGLKRSTVLEALRSLRDKHLIVAQQTRSANGSLAATIYALHVAAPPQPVDEEDPRQQVAGRQADVDLVRQSVLPGTSGRTTSSAPADEVVRQAARASSALADQQQTAANREINNKPPLAPPPGGAAQTRRRRRQRDEDQQDPERFSRGSYGVCPRCGMSPHDPDCPVLQEDV